MLRVTTLDSVHREQVLISLTHAIVALEQKEVLGEQQRKENRLYIQILKMLKEDLRRL